MAGPKSEVLFVDALLGFGSELASTWARNRDGSHSKLRAVVMSSIVRFVVWSLKRFTDCGSQDYTQAAVEVLIVCISAFLPLWAGMLVFSITDMTGSVAKYGNSFMMSGEMFSIACAIIGPLIYVVTKKYGHLADPLTLRFPYSTSFSIFIVLIWFTSGCVFVLIKATELFHVEIVDADALWSLSLTVTLAAVAILYFATVFRNFIDRIDAGRLMHDDQERFVKEFGDAGH